MVVLRLAICMVIGLGAFVAHAQPRDRDLPPVDPPSRWRQMTLDDATSDSKCVGKFDTALCAVETMIACFARRIDDFCAKSRLNPSPYPITGSVSGFWSRDLYRVARAEYLTKDSILNIPRMTFGVQPGDIRIDLQLRQCSKRAEGEYCGRPNSDPIIFTVRQTSLGWRIVDRGGPDVRWPGRKPQ
jgi:hypothetical protein